MEMSRQFLLLFINHSRSLQYGLRKVSRDGNAQRQFLFMVTQTTFAPKLIFKYFFKKSTEFVY